MTIRRRRLWRGSIIAVIAMAVGAAGAVAWAVHPQTWTHETEHDYTDGQFDNVVVDNHGELRLGREVGAIATEGKIDFVNAFAQGADGTIYFATSPKGSVYKIADKKATVFYTAPEAQDQILSLATDGSGNLLVAICGNGVKLVKLTAGPDSKATATTLFENSDIDYVWAIRTTPDGTVYLATGPKGQVWKVPANGGKASVVMETGGKNVYSLAVDGKGNIYAGTDSHGLVMKLNAQTGETFVLYDAGELDISALAVDEAGNVYAAAASPDTNTRPGQADIDTDDQGKPAKPDKPEPDAVTPDDPGQKNPEAPTTGDVAPSGKDKGKAETQKAGANLKGDAGPARTETPVAAEYELTRGLLGQVSPPSAAELKKMIEKAKRKAAAAGRQMPSPGRNSQTRGNRNAPNGRASPNKANGEEDTDEGNSVIKIAPDGTVTTLLKENDVMMSLLYRDGELLIGTGNEGKLYSYRPEQDAEAVIARVTNENIMSMFAAKDGTVYFGTSNSGGVYALGNNIAKTGTYTSAVLDAEHVAQWGSASLMATTPAGDDKGAKATLAVRSGNVKDVKQQEKFWSDWSAELPAGETGNNAKLSSPPARYLQYRVTITAEAKSQTPVVEQVRITYQVANLPPKIQRLVADNGSNDQDNAGSSPPQKSSAGTDDAGPDKLVHLSWDASDPNRDDLVFRLYYREVKDAGEGPWIPLDKDVKDMTYDWNTRAVSDGKYQVKVVASDAPDNAAPDAKATAEVTSPFLVVNTLPSMANVKLALDGAKVTITGTANATLCPVTEVRYQIDGGTPLGDWQLATATDKMFDSPLEGFTFTTRPMAVGSHRVTIRVTDSQGNMGYHTETVTVK